MRKEDETEDDYRSRDVITFNVNRHFSSAKLDSAINKSNRNSRSDAIENVVREAVVASPIVSFSGIPHIYSERDGIYIKFDYYDFKMGIYDAMRKMHIPDGCYGSIDRIVKLCWAEVQSRRRAVDNSVVAMANGVFDTMDHTLKDFDEKFMVNTKVDYKYNPNEKAVGWQRFLNEVLPDLYLQHLLQQFIAAAYVDRKLAKIEYALILLGKGSNGKSVVFEIISALIGKDAISNFSIADLISNNRRDQNIATCNGKRLNYCSEIRTTEIGEKNSDAFKSLVSGESQMARSLYREPFRASEIPLIMANANKLPKLADASPALQRRLLIIPFETYIPEEKQNVELAVELMQELPGIFNWAMEGLHILRSNRHKIDIPDKVKKIVADYVRENNLINRWIDENRMFSCCHPHTEPDVKWKTISTMYSEFLVWCKENNEAIKTKREFSYEVEMSGFIKARRAEGIGFLYYTQPDPEQIRIANMDIAIAMQSQLYLEKLREAATQGDKVIVEGIEDLERYLGLPKDCIYPYLRSGQLDGTYTNLGKGQPKFDVKKVQSALADAGFYTELNSDTNSCKRKATNVLKGMRESFNAQMRTMGVPIRKFSNLNGYIPVKDKDCWIVPDDWEYSRRAAELVMMKPKNSY